MEPHRPQKTPQAIEADLRYDLRRLIRQVYSILTPTTERFAAVDQPLRRLEANLEAHDAEAAIALVGGPESGKSLALNALLGLRVLPEKNIRKSLPIVPFLSEIPMLRLRSGKAIACDEDGCRSHLQSEQTLWLEAMADRRLHAPLPCFRGPKPYGVPWVAIDMTRNDSCVVPKVSSVATRVIEPTVLSASAFVYCVKATLLGTPQEDQVFDNLLGSSAGSVSASTLQRLLDHVTFLLTHSDYIFEIEDNISPVLRRTDSHVDGVVYEEQPNAIRTMAELKKTFQRLMRKRWNYEVPEHRILLFSGRNAFLTKQILMYEPDVQQLYDFCEVMFGGSFMQTVDDMEEGQLRRTVQRFAKDTMFQKSGVAQLTELFRLFDFNGGRYLLSDAASLALECVEQLRVGLVAAKPVAMREALEHRAELQCLVEETSWVYESTASIGHFVHTMSDDLVQLTTRKLSEFCHARLHELRYVLEHRDLAWFKERQACTIVEVQRCLNKLETFTETYLFQRGFLEKKIRDGRASAGGFEFLDQYSTECLAAMEREKHDLLLDFGAKFAHHLKDEFALFLPQIAEAIQARKSELLTQFLRMVEAPITQTTNRIGEPLDMDDLLEHLEKCELLQVNDRRLKNFLRELPEHVAVAGVELSNEWYLPLDDEVLANPTVASKRELHDAKMAKQAALAKINESALFSETNDESGFTMNHQVVYLLESWRLSLGMLQAQQLATYNIHELKQAVSNVTERVLNYIHRLVGDLEHGAVAQQAQVLEMDEAVRQMDDVLEKLGPFEEQLQELYLEVERGKATTLEEADRLADLSEQQ